jgi:putative ABC transport system permease protein
MIEIALPVFSVMTNHTVELELLSLISVLTTLGLLVGIVAGLYPSFYLSAVKPTAILKGKFLQSPKGAWVRKGFTVFQFSASMVLICSSIIIFHQLTSIKSRSLGFTKEEVIVLPIKNRDALQGRMVELQSELAKLPGLVSVSAVSNIPGRSFNQNEIYAVTQPDEPIDVSEMVVSYDVLNVLNIPLAEGRAFTRDNPADRESAFLLNETAASQLNLDQPVGKEIVWERDGQEIKGTVVGLVKDFHFQSLHQTVRPLLLKLGDNGFNFVIAKVSTTDFPTTLTSIESVWKKFDNRFAFDFFFLSDTVDQQYRAEDNMGKILVAFSTIAIVIACFGLLGIAALTFRNKTKEISVRKILGAELTGLVYLLLKDFTILILVSILLATPVAIWLMNDWLQNFSYRVEINPLVFVASGLLLVVIAWLTLGYLTFQVAKTNPATTLKNE